MCVAQHQLLRICRFREDHWSCTSTSTKASKKKRVRVRVKVRSPCAPAGKGKSMNTSASKSKTVELSGCAVSPGYRASSKFADSPPEFFRMCCFSRIL